MFLVVPPGGSFRETRRIELGPRALTLGRAESCDVRVDVPGVDPEHAKISEVALIAIGPDCAVGDVPLDPGARRLVTPGDEIQIGSVVVALEGELDDKPRSTDTVEADAVGRQRTDAPTIRVVEGQSFGEELILKEEGREYLVGRGPKCDLVLDDREVSREHVKLIRRGMQIFIQDLSSTRGSWLGRSSVYSQSAMEWQRPRMLRVGATVLSLELPEEARRTAPPALTSAPMTPPPRSRAGAPPGPLAAHPAQVPPAHRSEPPGSMPMAPPSAQALGAPPLAAGTVVAAAPPPPSAPAARRAWKKSGPTIGKGGGVLLLALAALAILGGLFVIFSILE